MKSHSPAQSRRFAREDVDGTKVCRVAKRWTRDPLEKEPMNPSNPPSPPEVESRRAWEHPLFLWEGDCDRIGASNLGPWMDRTHEEASRAVSVGQPWLSDRNGAN
jgi:hypothetical protein